MLETIVSTSPSRTYMVGIYDHVSPNEIRFERLTLPESAPNTPQIAKQHYLLDHLGDASPIYIMFCVPIEQYLASTNDMYTNKQKEDVELTIKMLSDWNNRQKYPSESHNMALSNLLSKVLLMESFSEKLAKLKETAWALLQIE